MRIYNTMTRRLEELSPLEPGTVKIYACGPTVYDYIHIGNARPLCVFDVLRRFLEWRGYKVVFVQNFTDVDDKIIKKALQQGIESAQVAARFMEEYWVDARGLHVRPATVHPRATDHIGEMLDIIQRLEEKGLAYAPGNGDVYYRTRAFADYGKLSHQALDDLESGARIAVGEQKEDALDFTLWKAAKPGEPAWDSPYGKGRPGWHIECSAMARRYLGDTVDIHCGGQDLIFPHHENEIAQSEGCTGVPFARYWMHNGHINVNNKKMSKSLGNFFTVRDAAKQFGYEAIRFFLISSSYRSPINYTTEVLTQAQAALKRLSACRRALTVRLQSAGASASDRDEGLLEGLSARKAQFIEALEDDLNTADAIAALFELARDVNLLLAQENDLSEAFCRGAADLFDELAGVLGLFEEDSEGTTQDDDAEIEELIAARTKARAAKDWAAADAIRDQLKARHIVLEDTPQGVVWHRT